VSETKYQKSAKVCLGQKSYGFVKNNNLRKNVKRIITWKHTGCSKKTDTQYYFWDNFDNSAPILTILSLLQAEIYGA